MRRFGTLRQLAEQPRRVNLEPATPLTGRAAAVVDQVADGLRRAAESLGDRRHRQPAATEQQLLERRQPRLDVR